MQTVVFHTKESISAVLAEALEVMGEHEIDGELKVPAFQLVFGNLALRQLAPQQVQMLPLEQVLGGGRRH